MNLPTCWLDFLPSSLIAPNRMPALCVIEKNCVKYQAAHS